MANVGDCINRPLFEFLTGRKPRESARRVTSGNGSVIEGVVGCGSILSKADGREVWGTGAGEDMDLSRIRPTKIHAVRGPLTRDRCLEEGWECPEIYGDPGWLLPLIYPPAEKKTHKVGWIAHKSDGTKTTGLRSELGIGVRHANVKLFVRQITSCEMIFSSSLHGLVIADAYGIPCAWVELPKNKRHMTFKYEDYFASMDCAPPRHSTRGLKEEYCELHDPGDRPERLLEVCPWRP